LSPAVFPSGFFIAESIDVARRAAIFAKLVPVVMGPCFRRDDIAVGMVHPDMLIELKSITR
jgi:hypothetical protein